MYLRHLARTSWAKNLYSSSKKSNPADTKLSDHWRGVTLKSFEFKNDADGRYATFTFERESILQSYNYVGALVLAPAAVHTADATALALTASQARYEIRKHWCNSHCHSLRSYLF